MSPYIWIAIGIFALLAIWFYTRYKSILSSMNVEESEHIHNLNDKNFKKEIAKGVVLVDFWAEWCQPCKIQGPIVNELANEISDRAKIAKLDVQENQQTAAQLGIRNIPTIIIFKNGEAVEKLVGLKTKKALLKALNKVLD